MMLSRDRILTTHVGSLPRNDELSDLLIQREEGEPVDMDRLRQAMDRAVEDVVKKQMAAGTEASCGMSERPHLTKKSAA